MTPWLEAYVLVTAVGALLCYFIACQKRLNLLLWVLVGLVLPIPALIAVTFEPADD